MNLIAKGKGYEGRSPRMFRKEGDIDFSKKSMYGMYSNDFTLLDIIESAFEKNPNAAEVSMVMLAADEYDDVISVDSTVPVEIVENCLASVPLQDPWPEAIQILHELKLNDKVTIAVSGETDASGIDCRILLLFNGVAFAELDEGKARTFAAMFMDAVVWIDDVSNAAFGEDVPGKAE